MEQKAVLEAIVKALDSKRAEDIQVIGVKNLTILGDYFVIANGTSTTHTKTLADEVEYQMTKLGIEPLHREGRGNGSNWIVLDYNDIIIHVFYKETRAFYQLERLWADGEKMDVTAWLKEDLCSKKGGIFYGKRKENDYSCWSIHDFKGHFESDFGIQCQQFGFPAVCSSFDFCNAETDSIQPVCNSHFSGTDFLGQLAGEPVEFGLELDLSGGRLAGCRCSCHFGIP